MNNQMKILFNDNLLKLKIPPKIQVGELITYIKKKLNIDEAHNLVLLNNERRFSDSDQILQKDINTLNKEDFLLMDLKEYRQLPSENKKSILKIKDTNSEKKSSDKKSKNDSKFSLQEAIKACTDAKTLLVVPKVVKSKRIHNRDRESFLNYLVDRLERDQGLDHYHEEEDYSDEEYEEDDHNFFDDEESEFSEYSSYHSHQPVSIQNNLQVQRVIPNIEVGSSLSLLGRNNANNIGGNYNARGDNFLSHYQPRLHPIIVPVNRDNSNNNARIQNNSHIRIIDHNIANRRVVNYDEDMLIMLLEMGFTLENSRIALRLTRNNIEDSTSLLLNAPDIIYAENLDLAGPNVNINNNVQNILPNNQQNSRMINEEFLSNSSFLSNSVPVDDSIISQELRPLHLLDNERRLNNNAEVNESDSESAILNENDDRGGRGQMIRINGVVNLEELNSLQDVLRMIARDNNVDYEIIRLSYLPDSESSEDEFRQNEEDN